MIIDAGIRVHVYCFDRNSDLLPLRADQVSGLKTFTGKSQLIADLIAMNNADFIIVCTYQEMREELGHGAFTLPT